MPVFKSKSIWPARVSWPRGGGGALPVLAVATPMAAPYVMGRSRFTLAPLSLSLDQIIFLITAALLAFGLVMVQSADSRVTSVTEHWVLQSFNNKNAIHAAIAILAMALMWRYDYRKLLGKSFLFSAPTIIIAFTIVSLILVLVTPLGMSINGARRWLAVPLGITKISIQPSEFAKLALVLFISAYAVYREHAIRLFIKGFVPLIAIFGMTAALVVVEDFGTTALICAVCFVLLMMSGCKWWHIALLIPPALFAAYILLWHSKFRRDRLLIFLHPEIDPKGIGYHPLQSLLTISSGGLWGRGLGNGIQKMGYLPEDNTDFIFSVICEELGCVGAFMVIGLFVAFTAAGWRIATRAKNLFGKMIAFGITATVALQAAINIAVVTVTVPTKGIALPFISSGGTGWIMNAIAIGLLMSVERVNRNEAREQARANAPAAPALGFPVEMGIPITPASAGPGIAIPGLGSGNPAAGGGAV
jgi:cell division protein FtsW